MPFNHGHALLIGVGTHKNAPQLNVLKTIADARAVAEVLRDQNLCGYPTGQVQVLHDEYAARDGILGALEGLAQRAGVDDTVLIYYCGHGDYGTDGEYYLVSHDAQLDGVKICPGSGVSQASLVDRLRAIPAKRLLVIFNACHSGEISPTLGVDQAVGAKVLPSAAADALLSTGSGRIIITACREGQFSYIGDGPLTLFTQALVEGFQGLGILPRGGAISAFDLYTALYEKVSQAVQARYQKQQEPELTVLKGVGPFAVALYQGASNANLSLAEAPAELPVGAAARAVSPERSQRLYQQILQQSGGVNFGVGNVIDIGGSVIGTQTIATGGGAYVGGNVVTGGGDFVGRDQVKTTTQGATLEQFSTFLADLRAGLGASGLQESDRQAIEAEVASVETNARAAQPNKKWIVAKLTGVQALLEAAVGAGSAAYSLIQLVQKGIELAQQVFR